MKRFVLYFAMAITVLLLLASCGSVSETTGTSVNLGDGGVVEGSQGLLYTYDGELQGYFVSGIGSCRDRELVIPRSYNGRPVVGIAAGAFKAAGDAEVGVARPLGFVFDGISDFGGGFGGSDAGSEADGEVGGEFNGFESVEIPDSVIEIGDEAFMGCEELEDVSITSLVNMIGSDAFKDTAFYNDPENWENGLLYLEHYLVEARADLSGEVSIREGITHIASGAFKGTAITGVVFPTGMASIGEEAFRDCGELLSVDLGFAGIHIGRSAFWGCTKLRSVVIGDDSEVSVLPIEDQEKIAKMGLLYLDNDETVVANAVVSFTPNYFSFPKVEDFVFSTVVESNAFYGCSSLTDVTVGKNLEYIGDFAFGECTSLVTVSLEKMTVVKNDRDPAVQRTTLKFGGTRLSSVFYGCTSLENVTLPEGLTVLYQTFKECTSLKTITLPSTVTVINRTFEDCTSLVSVTLPEGLKKVSYSAFRGCRALTAVTVPDSVTLIREGAFFALGDNAEITLGRSLETIGEGAFSGNVTIVYGGTKAEWGNILVHGAFVAEGSATVRCLDGDLVK